MLEPNNKTIHAILQPLREESLSCHVLNVMPISYLKHISKYMIFHHLMVLDIFADLFFNSVSILFII